MPGRELDEAGRPPRVVDGTTANRVLHVGVPRADHRVVLLQAAGAFFGIEHLQLLRHVLRHRIVRAGQAQQGDMRGPQRCLHSADALLVRFGEALAVVDRDPVAAGVEQHIAGVAIGVQGQRVEDGEAGQLFGFQRHFADRAELLQVARSMAGFLHRAGDLLQAGGIAARDHHALECHDMGFGHADIDAGLPRQQLRGAAGKRLPRHLAALRAATVRDPGRVTRQAIIQLLGGWRVGGPAQERGALLPIGVAAVDPERLEDARFVLVQRLEHAFVRGHAEQVELHLGVAGGHRLAGILPWRFTGGDNGRAIRVRCAFPDRCRWFRRVERLRWRRTALAPASRCFSARAPA
jgi:hypothetical protein